MRWKYFCQRIGGKVAATLCLKHNRIVRLNEEKPPSVGTKSSRKAAGRRLLRRGARGVRNVTLANVCLPTWPSRARHDTANAGNDAGGIATSPPSAPSRLSTLWIRFRSQSSLGLVQEIAHEWRGHRQRSRRFDSRTVWRALDSVVMLAFNRNGGNTSEFVGIAQRRSYLEYRDSCQCRLPR